MWIKGFWFPASVVSASIPEKLPLFQQERLQLLLSGLDIKEDDLEITLTTEEET